MVLIILSFLGAALLIGLLVVVSVVFGGFVADVWYSYVILAVIAALLIWYAFWKMEDEYFVFTNAKQKRAERRAAQKTSSSVKVKYRQPYSVEGADETYTEFEAIRYLIRNNIDGQERFVRFNTLIEGGYTPAMAWYGYIKVHGLFDYKVDKKEGLSWLRSAAEKGCPVAHAYLYWLYIKGTKTGVKKNEKKALEHLEKALKVDHIIPLAYLAKGDECLRNDDLKGAKAWYEKAVAKNPNYGYYELAKLTYKDKSIGKALSREMELAYLEKAVTNSSVLYAFVGIYDEKGEHRRAFVYALEAAHMHDEQAQVQVAYYYYNGMGVKKDYEKAFEWNMEAAKHDEKQAQYNLGQCYREGIGVAKDPVEAIAWYMKAAEQGHTDAQFNLGCCYHNGIGVDKNYAEAVKWYKKAAEQGNASAQGNLGYCYQKGDGVVKNQTEAVKWYRKAAEQGNANAQSCLGLCYEEGNGVEKNYAEAAKWYRKAAEQGDASAQSGLGYCYEMGYGVARDNTEAVKWYRKAAEQGYAWAQDKLGYRYHKGLGVAMNNTEAVKWFRKAAEQGQANGQYNLGVCYENGYGVDKSLYEAKKWYQKAAAQGHEKAKEALKKLR